MNICGDVTFFVKRYTQTENKPDRLVFTTNIKRAFAEGEASVSRTLDIAFAKKTFPEEKLQLLKEDVAYTLEVTDGWLTLNRFKKKGEEKYTYNIALMINEAKEQPNGSIIKKATKVDTKKREQARKEAKARKQAEQAQDQSPLGELADDLPF